MFRHILVGLDGSPGSLQAFDVALGVARQFGATLRVLSVIEHDPRYAGTVGEVREETEFAENYLRPVQENAQRRAQELGVPLETVIEHGHAAQQIIGMSRRDGIDLVVVGHSGHSGVWGALMGSTADKVSRHALTSVLVVR